MKSYPYFRESIGLKGPEIEKLTGYTKQGLYYAFNMIDEGKQPAKKFLVCINAAIEKRMKEETKVYEEKMNKLRELQEKFGGGYMKNHIIGIDLASGPDKTAYTEIKETIQDKIYQAYGLSKKQIETNENTEALEKFLKINNVK